jgi:trans-2,3-dihydro-3-hydroxyanthranilate isomerase
LQRTYYLLDVFTETLLAGNPLAVVTDCDGLDAAAMQKIAAEFNLSETVFILPPADPANTARLRIFTPKTEVPFAGHPTIGTAVLLAKLRGPALSFTPDFGLTLEEEIGLISATVHEGEAPFASFELPRLPAQRGMVSADESIAAALGLSEEDIGFEAHRPSVYSAGLPFAFVPVAGLATIARARVVPAAFDAAFNAIQASAVYLYTSDTIDPNHTFHARMFAPSLGVAEDPATGSAAAALAGVIMQFDRPGDGSHRLVIEQGYEMGRPSTITLELRISGHRLIAASIGGSAVILAQGIINL